RYCDLNCISRIASCRLSQCCKSTSEERSAGNPHATFCGNRRRATASGDPVGVQQWASLPRSSLSSATPDGARRTSGADYPIMTAVLGAGVTEPESLSWRCASGDEFVNV